MLAARSEIAHRLMSIPGIGRLVPQHSLPQSATESS
jgi:hypothetical protein